MKHRVEVEGHPHGEEEEPEQNAAEGLDLRLDRMSEGGIRQHQPGDEGAHGHRHARNVHERGGAEHDQERRGGHDLARSGDCQEPEERVEEVAAGADKHDERHDDLHDLGESGGCEGCPAGRQDRHQGQQRDDGDVLEKQDGGRLLTVGGGDLVALGERLHAEGGG